MGVFCVAMMSTSASAAFAPRLDAACPLWALALERLLTTSASWRPSNANAMTDRRGFRLANRRRDCPTNDGSGVEQR